MTSNDTTLSILRDVAVDLISVDELLGKLRRDAPLRVKYGADPTSPDLHLGHAVSLGLLGRLQGLGHTIVLIIGDFTARIGDPSGRSKTRPMLTAEQIEENLGTYIAQVGRFVDVGGCEIHRNGEWFDHMSSSDLLRVMSHHTLAQILDRNDLSDRHRDGLPISMPEMVYPMLQAHDSVMVEADLEIGGTDQLHNLCVGRDYMRSVAMESQCVATLPLLVGTDGCLKMGKSTGNCIGVTDEPNDMFGKVMSLPDHALPQYVHAFMERPPNVVTRSAADDPMLLKGLVARRIVAMCHGEDAADGAAEEFQRTFSRRELPSDIRQVSGLCGERWIVDLLRETGMAATNGEARRMVRQNGVMLGGTKVIDERAIVAVHDGDVLRFGRRFVRLVQGSTD